MTKSEKIMAIIEAEQNGNFSDDIGDIDILSYKDENGVVWEDLFDYIDSTQQPVQVCFIAGTGFNDFQVPIHSLTAKSINRLYECVIPPSSDGGELICFEVETRYKSGRTKSEILTFSSEKDMWKNYDRHHNAKLIDSSLIADAWPA